jgi:oxygen-independent coproporphyrinogen-3 oxidase
MENKELGIYIHIPFCKSKCYYCDFISYTNRCEQVEEYIKKVIKEMEQYDLSNYNVTTIYIGGGTPSYIDEKYIKEFLEKLKTKLVENKTKFEDIEITIEINPGTITSKKLKQYKDSGVNRISIGLQSTNDALLKQIGRIHNYQEFLEAYEMVRKTGFENINVDLMIGLPNQTILDIKKTLEEIKKLNPNHVSVYSLIVEEETKIEELINSGKLQLPDEEVERQMYWYVKNTLELNGYKHYEISNFAKEGKESKHNLNCWEQKEYIGLGAAAHSYLNGVRYSNSTFIKSKLWDFKNKKIEEKQTLKDKKKEYMLLGLRKIDGVSIQKFKEKYVDNPIFLYRNEIEKLVEDGLLEIEGDYIRLTNKGIDFANLVWEEFV